MAVVTRLSIPLLIFYFVIYILIHCTIVKWKERLDKENTNKPNVENIMKDLKMANHLYKWVPAYYVLLLLFLLNA